MLSRNFPNVDFDALFIQKYHYDKSIKPSDSIDLRR